MNSNIEDDPWSSGWNDDNDNNNINNTSINDPLTGATATTTPYQSSYLTSSQLFTSTGGGGGSGSGGGYNSGVNTYNTTIPPNLINVPSSYETIYSHFITKYNNNNSNSTFTLNDFEINIIDKLISLNYLTNYQKQKILDIIYENNLLPINQSFKFYQILGLLALEIDVPGTGDYVTLQFRLNNNLPDLPEKFINEIINEENEQEEQTSGLLGNRNRSIQSHSHSGPNNQDDWNIDDSTTISGGGGGNFGDPLLVDHSYIHDDLIDESRSVGGTQPQQGGSGSGSGSGSGTIAPNVDSSYIEKYINDIKDQFKPLFSGIDLIKIKEVPEKEGIIFKHINYMITHDLKIGGTSSGTKKRRRGLHRFLNQLIKHPILSQEPIVQSFLTVPTDLTTWKKQAKIDSSLEFKGQKIQTDFINVIWPIMGEPFLKKWRQAEENIQFIIDKWVKIIILVERYERRQQQISFDNGKFAEMLNGFSKLNTKIYPDNEDNNNSTRNDVNVNVVVDNNENYKQDFDFNSSGDIININQCLNSIGEFFNKSSQVLIDESYIINTKTLEKFKNYLDYLNSLQELFERTKQLSINQIDLLDKRIKDQEIKFKKISEENPDIKGGELIKLRQSIINDKQEIFQQLNKDWLIKQCCLQEFIIFQETQFLITELWVEWCKDRLKCQEKLVGLYDNLNQEIIHDMPLER
ncbi:conserved hypothetical protein [Candida albicans WO-1]|uniref:Sorting nexin MVP1 n=1 Tax=Candida albicans (strain WO-1) TaxID=294748 RepID=C4YTE6_CANAW|nr:conserved hypothetical protein [Candida albicans WO-1]